MFHDSPLSSPDLLRWLYVDFNSYFASVEQQLSPGLRHRPIIVVPVMTDSTCAIAASYEAKAFGIKTGTPVYEARRKCPGLVCVQARHEHYVDFHHRLIDEIGRHIPVSAVCSIDEMACRLMKNESGPETAVRIARSIKAGISQNIGPHIRCSIGVAPNKYLAKIATDMQKPDGLVVLKTEALPHSLLGLALRDLPGVGANVEKRLHRAGIFDIKTLLQLQPRHLRAVWGNIWGEKLWYLLRGYDLPDIETSRSTIGHSHVLAPDLRPPDAARVVARRLLMKAAARLRRMEYDAAALVLSARLESGPRLAIEGKCRPMQDSPGLLALMDALWETLAVDMAGQRLRKVSVTLNALTPAAERGLQGDLFFMPEERATRRAKNDRISQAMDALNRKFGRDTVLMGIPSHASRSFSGTKVAFTRIPDADEFLE